MNAAIVEAYVKAFLATQPGQMMSSFVRICAATVVGCWINAGSPMPPSSDQVVHWLCIAGPSSLSLVLANYFGPWEARYGRRKRITQKG